MTPELVTPDRHAARSAAAERQRRKRARDRAAKDAAARPVPRARPRSAASPPSPAPRLQAGGVSRSGAAPHENLGGISIIQAVHDPAIWGRWFRDPSTWTAWITFLRVLFGLPLDGSEVELFRQCTGRATALVGGFYECWLACGRRAGKSLIWALVAVFLGVFRDWRPFLAPGERAVIMVLAADRRQSRVIMRYVRALIREVPALAVLIERETAEAIDLSNRVTIEITTANYRTTRGYTLVAALCDEITFWSSDETGANPDTEVLAALRPAMSTIPGSVLLAASSPYGRAGALWKAHQKFYGVDDAPVLVWRAATRTMNPTVPQSVVDEAYERDPASAAAEYGAEFRIDVAGFLSSELIETAIDRGVVVRPPVPGVIYFAFADPSGGVTDSFTLAIAHQDDGAAVLDMLFEARAPFNPSGVCSEIAKLLQSYGLGEASGDRYGSAWVVEAFAAEAIGCRHSLLDRSAIYLNVLPLFTTGRVRLLDHPRLAAQFGGLERRLSPAGRDRVDHGPQGHDDLCNSAAGALVLAGQREPEVLIITPWVGSSGEPIRGLCDPDWT